MIKYKTKDNKIIAYFARNYNNDNNFWQWMDEIYANVSKQLGLNHHFETIINDKTYKYLFHKSNFYGIAKCHPNDVFDEQVGKRIARERLLAKFYIICDKVKQDVIDELLKVVKLDLSSGCKITNGDKIRSMTDEELADLLTPTSCDDCSKYKFCWPEKPRQCLAQTLKYLTQEVEGEF